MELNVNDLEWDIENPRISNSLDMYGPNPTPYQISMALSTSSDSNGAGTIDVLRESIKNTGGITQPIIVNHTDSRYVVIEGNTRLALYKEFIEKKVKGDWTKIPAIVHEEMTEEAKHQIRLQCHIVGPRAWNPYSKAKYLKKLRDEELFSINRIIDLCGGQKTEIIEMINAFDDMEKYYHEKVNDDVFDVRQFSVFRELNSKKKSASALVANGFDKNDFGKWVIEGKIGEAANVRKLPDVLNDPNLRKIFLDKDLKTAISHIKVDSNEINADIKTVSEHLLKEINKLSWKDVDAIRKGESHLEDSLSFLLSTLNNLFGIDAD